jgi:hypothetical protein
MVDALGLLGLVIHGSSSVTIPAPNFNAGAPKTASSQAMVMSQVARPLAAQAGLDRAEALRVLVGQAQPTGVEQRTTSPWRISTPASWPRLRSRPC